MSEFDAPNLLSEVVTSTDRAFINAARLIDGRDHEVSIVNVGSPAIFVRGIHFSQSGEKWHIFVSSRGIMDQGRNYYASKAATEVFNAAAQRLLRRMREAKEGDDEREIAAIARKLGPKEKFRLFGSRKSSATKARRSDAGTPATQPPTGGL